MSKPMIPKEWLTNATTPIFGVARKATLSAAEAGWDISAANFSVWFRAYQDGDDAALLVEEELDLDTGPNDNNPGESGFFSGNIPAIGTAYDSLIGEIRVLDSDLADANTPSGNAEYLLERTRFRVTQAAT